jgi:hypothetical protein
MSNAVSVALEIIVGLLGAFLFVKFIGWTFEYAAVESRLLQPEKPTCEHGAYRRHPIYPEVYDKEHPAWLPSSHCDGP